MKTGTLRLAFYCTVLFVSGMAVGALSHRYYVQDVVAAKAPPRKGADYFRQAYLSEMRNRLKLNDEQTVQLENILDDTRNQFRTLREQQRPQMDAIQEEQTRRIDVLLTPEQQAEFARMREEREQKRKADEARRHAEEQAARERRNQQQAPPTQ
jgi:hypothetical protein